MNRLKKQELRQRCEDAGISSNGNRQELLKRLKEHEKKSNVLLDQNEKRKMLERIQELESTIARMNVRNSSDSESELGATSMHRRISPTITQRFAMVDAITPHVSMATPVVTNALPTTVVCNEQPRINHVHQLTGRVATSISTPTSSGLNAPTILMEPLRSTSMVTTAVQPSVATTTTGYYTQSGFVPQQAYLSHPTGMVSSSMGAIPSTHYGVPTVPWANVTPHPMNNNRTTMLPQMTQFPNFNYCNANDISSLLPEFNPIGDKTLSSVQFIQRVEALRNAYNWREDLLILAVQQKLKGHAKSWLDAQRVIFVSWSQFVQSFMQNFPFRENAADAHINLANTKRSYNEPPLEYFYKMQALGTKYGLPDNAIARHIINGVILNKFTKKSSESQKPTHFGYVCWLFKIFDCTYFMVTRCDSVARNRMSKV